MNHLLALPKYLIAENNKTNVSFFDSFVFAIILFFASWTILYHIILISRLPSYFSFYAITLALIFPTYMIIGKVKENKKILQHVRKDLLIIIISILTSITVSTILRPDLDDAEFFHRAYFQLKHLKDPFFIYETSVNIKNIYPLSYAHIATSYEPLCALLAYFLSIHPTFFYQVIIPLFLSFLLPNLYYKTYMCLGLSKYQALFATIFVLIFLLVIDGNTHRSYGNITFVRLWQGKTILWSFLLPLNIYSIISYIKKKNVIYSILLFCISISSVGLSNSSLYLLPVMNIAFASSYLLTQILIKDKINIKDPILIFISSIYNIIFGLLFFFKILNVPPNRGWEEGWPQIWWQNLYLVMGNHFGLINYLSIIFFAISLISNKFDRYLFLFFLIIMFITCFNPIMGIFWIENIKPASYWRFMYIIPIPLFFGILSLAIPFHKKQMIKNISILGIIVCTTVLNSQRLVISQQNISFKKPIDLQIPKHIIPLKKVAETYLYNKEIIAPLELSAYLLLFESTIKVIAPRGIVERTSISGIPHEGILRLEAQQFVTEPTEKTRISFLKVIHNTNVNIVICLTQHARHIHNNLSASWEKVWENSNYTLFARLDKNE